MRKMIFLIENGAVSLRKKQEVTASAGFSGREGAAGRSWKKREESRQIRNLFEPYLKEIMAQFAPSGRKPAK